MPPALWSCVIDRAATSSLAAVSPDGSPDENSLFQLRFSMLLSLCATPVLGLEIPLVSFDGATGTTFEFKVLNDPVMGGKSHATWTVPDNFGVLAGEVVNVPSLKARSRRPRPTLQRFLCVHSPRWHHPSPAGAWLRHGSRQRQVCRRFSRCDWWPRPVRPLLDADVQRLSRLALLWRWHWRVLLRWRRRHSLFPGLLQRQIHCAARRHVHHGPRPLQQLH